MLQQPSNLMPPLTEPTSITNYHLEEINQRSKNVEFYIRNLDARMITQENLASEQVYYLKKISRNISAVCIVIVLAGLLIIGSLM